MATHVVKGDDGETVYLNDAEYKRYKSRKSCLGCLTVIIFVIFILIMSSSRDKQEKARNEATQENPPVQFTEDSNS